MWSTTPREKCLAIEVDTSLSGARTARVLDHIAEKRGRYPSRIVLDNGPECTSEALDKWANKRGVDLAFIRPGKPIENCFVESFKRALPRRVPQRPLVSEPR